MNVFSQQFCVAVAMTTLLSMPDVHGATLTTLVSFNGTNGDGPLNALVQAKDGSLYGTTLGGGRYNAGTIFKMSPDSGLTTLFEFDGTNGPGPWGPLVQGADGAWYGVTYGNSEANPFGTVFRMDPSGTLTTLVSFNRTNGAYPSSGLIRGQDNAFYGTTMEEGAYGGVDTGVIFRVTPSGEFNVLVSFDINYSDGFALDGGIMQGTDGNFYGTRAWGGANHVGSVFRMTSSGTLSTLFSFDGTNGSQPMSRLIQGTDGNLYGTTGAYSYSGTVFRISPGGTFESLAIFYGTNGASPLAAMVQGADGDFYGTTFSGGAYTYQFQGAGTIFRMKPDGTLTTLFSFNGTNGAGPRAALVYGPDGNLYGTTESGGSYGAGTIFRLSLGSGSISTVSNVRANQRSGTTLVDLFYDLSGAGSASVVSVAVSSDGGASFEVPATRFTGDGVTSPTAPGLKRHIVWDAGTDLPGQYSTKMRLQLAINWGGPNTAAVSPIFTLDTRTVPKGTLSGLVQGNGIPIPNAQVRLDGTVFVANTASDGTFVIANVPAGSGYLLKVSAVGFASKQVPRVKVTSGTTDLGTIQLANLGGPYRVIPLQPDVNPPVTQIEDGGVGYRYYKVVTVDGRNEAGGVKVSVATSSGDTIAQAGDTTSSWPGITAGVSDDDGIVRLVIPSSAMFFQNSSYAFQVMASGMAQQNFTAQVVPRRYEQLWKNALDGGGGVSVPINDVLDAAGAYHSAYETTVSREFGGREAGLQVVGRRHDDEVKIGVSLGDSVRINNTGKASTAGAGYKATASLGTSFRFSPDTQDPTDNLMKLYAGFADYLRLVPLGGGIVSGVENDLERTYLANDLEETTASLRLGQSAEAEAGFGGAVPFSDSLAVYAWADLSADVGLEVGVENHQSQYVDYYAELVGDFQVSVDVKNVPGLSLNTPIFLQPGGLVRATVRNGPSGQQPLQLILDSKLALTAESTQPVPGWPLDALISLQPLEKAEYGYRYTLSLPTLNNAGAIADAAWSSLQRQGQGTVFTINQPVAWLSSILAGGGLVTYENRQYSAKVGQADVLNLDLGLNVFKISLEGSLQDHIETGAELTRENGIVWQGRRFGLARYNDLPKNYYPSQTIFDLEASWAGYATAKINNLLNRAEAYAANLGETVIKWGSATLHLGQGVVNSGSHLITTYVLTPVGIGPKHSSGRRPLDLSLANLTYGIGGIYRIDSTNALNGVGTLTIAYSSTEIVGLNPADLRIYSQPDGTNRWQLVGGTVVLASNIVTATIGQLGTYTLAPPLPTGGLILTPSTNMLAADGASQLTVVVTNLMLNTGTVATQQWMFTATAVGMNILNTDLDPTTPGAQVLSTNGTVTLRLGAMQGGNVAHVTLSSVVGDAAGDLTVNLIDNSPPATPSAVSVTAGQSRIWVSWRTNSEPDIAGYRVYYRTGQAGPPWDGISAIEGVASPVMVVATNCLLRGLPLETNYYVAVSAVDTTGNESPWSVPVEVTTSQAQPAPPTSVSVQFGLDGTNILMWALSEDDGYNDRDVVRYDVFRAILPGGSYDKIGEASPGVGLFSDTNLSVGSSQYVGYSVEAVAQNGMASSATLANRLMADGLTIDNDGDGIPDWWMLKYFGHSTGLADDHSLAQADATGDGLTNLQKYRLGLSPVVQNRPWLQQLGIASDGGLLLAPGGLYGRSATLQYTTNLAVWLPLVSLGTNTTVEDFSATNSEKRFYRVTIP